MRRFSTAILLSLALHIIAVSGGWLRVPQPVATTPVLEARLVKAPQPDPPPPAVIKPEPAAKPVARAPAAPRILALPPDAAPGPFALPPEPEPMAPAEEATEASPAPPGADTPEPFGLAEAANAVPQQEPPPVTTLPRKGRITYAVHIGSDGYHVGKTVQSWEIEGRTYRLGSVAETTGFAELFRSQRLIYLSRGKITARGLQPEHFLMSRTRRGRTEEARARFDREAKTLTFGRMPGEQMAALAEDAQDIVSFMYQLALAPPMPGRIVLPITNGSRYEAYEIDVMAEELLETPLGTMRTLPLRQVHRPGTESLAVWLAVEYRYLPVRIRFFDREGNPSGEQMVSDISISED